MKISEIQEELDDITDVLDEVGCTLSSVITSLEDVLDEGIGDDDTLDVLSEVRDDVDESDYTVYTLMKRLEIISKKDLTCISKS